MSAEHFGSHGTLRVGDATYQIHRLDALAKAGIGHVEQLPFSLKILTENLLRRVDGKIVRPEDVERAAGWDPARPPEDEVQFMPARVLLQDFTGVPCVVDLAAMRDAMDALGGDASKINPLVPVDLVIDHSVQVDYYGSPDAAERNARLEMDRNLERYELLRWAQRAFDNFRLVPPDSGIVHQVNLEYLASVVFTKVNGAALAYPDTLVGTDSHTTMINGLGVLGWGVGGIEAEAALLGQPVSMLVPDVAGFKLTGSLRDGATATDLVLVVTEMLRQHGVVGKFVEFYGPGLSSLALASRATIANMAPEYGATCGYFPVDDETLAYLRLTGRDEQQVALVEAYCKEQGLFRTDATRDPIFTSTLSLDLSTVEPSLAGPRRPQDRVALSDVKSKFRQELPALVLPKKASVHDEPLRKWTDEGGATLSKPLDADGGLDERVRLTLNGTECELHHGSLVIAAITSCTNTSNPEVMLGAGLLAKKAVERGLQPHPWVKASLAPGSRVVIDYLEKAELLSYLEQLGFFLAGYGCTTCIGNSGPLPEPVASAIDDSGLVAAAVLSGNRNFEGRIHPQVRANYLGSPPLVVAYALAGRIDIDLDSEPLGVDRAGAPVFLRDIWPSEREIDDAVRNIGADMFRRGYGSIFDGTDEWKSLEVPGGDHFEWDAESTYVRRPPYFEGLTREPPPLRDIVDARALVVVGDSVTTDHVSPAGSIAKESPAAKYLRQHEVEQKDFNSYGARRGNHEVMMRGTFANVRVRNKLTPEREGWWTQYLPLGEEMSVYDAAMRYEQEGVPLIVLAGKEYGTGSSRDWAAKGPALLGVRAAIAESFERIHRSNLIGMGVLPLEYMPGESADTLGLSGREQFTIHGIADGLKPGAELTVSAKADDGRETRFKVICRIDTPVEADYYRHGGILQFVLRQLAG